MNAPHRFRYVIRRRSLERMGASMRILTVLICLVASRTAVADPLSVDGAWVRLPPPSGNAAAYMTLTNEGSKPIVITNVRSASIERVELHRSFERDGVARMERLSSLTVPAKSRIELAPRGLHVMLIRPGKLAEGQSVELELTLEDGDTQRVAALVAREAPRGERPPEGDVE